jgi:hypothetical protein
VKAWPTWAKVMAGLLLFLIVLAPFVSEDEPDERKISADAPPTTTELRSTTTEPKATTTQPTTTSTTATTTTAPPATAPPTTAAPTTAAPTKAVPPTTAAPPPPPADSCHPGYSGCVPLASDVDCEGGGGNGPEFVTGPVQIFGDDPYGLDGNDNDGIGCESE